MIAILIFSTLHRLYTGPKDSSRFNILSSTQAYEKVMKNNVDLELSFNSWDTSIQKTLNTSKSAIFADSQFLDWPELKDLPCMVRVIKIPTKIRYVYMHNIYFSVQDCMEHSISYLFLCYDEKRFPVYKNFFKRNKKTGLNWTLRFS